VIGEEVRRKVTTCIIGEAKVVLVWNQIDRALHFCWAKKLCIGCQTSTVFWLMARSQHAGTPISLAQSCRKSTQPIKHAQRIASIAPVGPA
jgi:hypothetical protein